MSAAQAARPATLSRVFSWISLVLAVAACSSAGPGDAPDGANVDAAVQALTEAECVAKNTDCLKATWTNVGTCEFEPKPGLPCGDTPSVCAGVCSDGGTCVGPGPEVHCGSASKPCSLCDGKGHCAINSSGAVCAPTFESSQCITKTGTCDANGECELAVKVGAACLFDMGSCGAGVCEADGYCAPASEGLPCGDATGICRKSDGTCDAAGHCIGAADIGAACAVNSSSCSSGVCNAEATCVANFAGKTCDVNAPSLCRKLKGLCSTDGICIGEIDVGAACPDKSSPCGGICNSLGTCDAVSAGALCGLVGGQCPTVCTAAGDCVGTGSEDCIVVSGKCAGKPGICGLSGLCSPIAPCAAAVFASSCDNVPKGNCAKPVVSYTGGVANCAGPFAVVPNNFGTCGVPNDPCKPLFCNTDDLSDNCWFSSPLKDGTPCPGTAANPCNASTCQAGKCTKQYKPVGTSCTPTVLTQCGEFACSIYGKCEPLPAQVTLPGPCTAADGDTDCWAKSCDGSGNCQAIARPAGEHCGAYPDNECATFACDGKGNCLPELLADQSNCPDARCSEYSAKPGSPCTGGPCVASGCSALGVCSTAYLPTGATCTIADMIGSCDASHRCVVPAKALGAAVGTPCQGTFPCMKEGVSYGADGMCHGTVAVGAACGSLCNPGTCSADGTCQQAFAGTDVFCGDAGACGALVCDGKGGCSLPVEKLGQSCNTIKTGECYKYGCDSQGKCMIGPVAGNPCSTGNACQSGLCNANGQCVATKLSGNACVLAPASECLTGVCANGTCTGAPLTGKACGKDTACMAYSCNASGQCAGTPKVGSGCESTGTCKKGVCDASGQCKQELTPGAKCVGKQQCMEGTCNAGGGCEFTPKPAGSQCTAAAPGTDWSCYTGACDGKGGCDLKVNTGASCKLPGQSDCMSGVCQSDASCKAVPGNLGKACKSSCVANGTCAADGQCKGDVLLGSACDRECHSGAKCNKEGECVGTVTTGYSCGPIFDPAGRCVSAQCKSDGTCAADVFAPAGKPCWQGIATAVSAASYYCGSWAGTCDGKGSCVATTVDPDGTPCGAAEDTCALSRACKGGLCVPAEPKADLTVCNYGCGKGVCRAGACDVPTTGGYDMAPPEPCADGDPCTMDICGGGALPKWPVLFNPAEPGKCGNVQFGTCVDGKPPVESKTCKDSDCGKDACGLQLYCKFSWGDKIGACGLNYNLVDTFGWESQSNCDDKSPCTLDGCNYGSCVHQPINNGISCGPFKQCQGGKCVPWN